MVNGYIEWGTEYSMYVKAQARVNTMFKILFARIRQGGSFYASYCS